MNLKEIRILYEYDKWALDRVLDAAAALTAEQYGKNLASSHGGIRGTLVHCYAAYEIWFARWRGESPMSLIKEEELPTLSSLRERWNDFQKDIHRHFGSLTETALQAPLTYKDTKGNPYTVPLWQQMQHLVNHSTYHRGQVIALLRQIGAKTVGTDLINYYRSQLK